MLVCPLAITLLKNSANTFVCLLSQIGLVHLFTHLKELLIRMNFTYLIGVRIRVTFLKRLPMFTFGNRRIPCHEWGAVQPIGRDEVQLT